MKGYLLKEATVVIGEESFFESQSSEANYAVMFEDDGDTGYFYAAEKNLSNGELTILDMLFIYDVEQVPVKERRARLSIIWSTDWQRCGLVLGGTCYAVFDFEHKAGYNLTGFPPPNIWSGHERKLSKEMVAGFFSK